VTQSNPYIPSRGDIVYLDFDPTKGHEQKGLRPAFVLSPRAYNQKSSLPIGLKVQGVILADQIKCLDWKVRGVRFVESVSEDVIEEVQTKIEPLLF
jgi:mRNA interferase MazF